MAEFEKAIPHILENEGGYINHPNDPGGATNFGISLRFLRSVGVDIDQDGDIDSDDIKLLNGESASSIYKKYFWEPNKYLQINSQSVATKAFDLAVNMGSSRANKIIQKATNIAHKNDNLIVDGIMGGKTIEAINKANVSLLEDFICQGAATYYLALIHKNPKLGVFQKGWLTRANKRYGD